MVLFGKGIDLGGDRNRGLPPDEVNAVLKEKGHLPVSVALRCRVTYFTDGAVLGSQEFVANWIRETNLVQVRKRVRKPRIMEGSDWGGLAVLRSIRRPIPV